MRPGNVIYGSWKDGSDIYKDSKGYYIIQWNPKTGDDFKKYVPKSWKPDANTRPICRTPKKMVFCNTLKNKKKNNKTKKRKF